MAQRKVLLRDRVYDDIRASIRCGELVPGERIVEYKLAADLGVSQGPVREALQRLGAEGVVVTVRHIGTFVRDVKREDLEQMLEVRGVLESLAADLALKRGVSDADVLELRGLFDQMSEAAHLNDLPRVVELDVCFHEHIFRMSGNAALAEVGKPVFSQIRSFISVTHIAYFKDLVEVAEAHRPLLQALAARDAVRVRAEIAFHSSLARLRAETADSSRCGSAPSSNSSG